MNNNINPDRIDNLDKIVDRRKKNIKLKDVIRYSQRGLSCREVGRILGCSKQSISKRFRYWQSCQLKQCKNLTGKGLKGSNIEN